MSGTELETLRRWARGDFYSLNRLDQGALDRLAIDSAAQPEPWWLAFKELIGEVDRSGMKNLEMPFAALLEGGGEEMRAKVAQAAHDDGKLATAFWNAMAELQLSKDAYESLGRRMTVEAFARHEPRIPSKPGDPWPEDWEDEWSGDALDFLTKEDRDEAWVLCLDLLEVSGDAGWIASVGAFVVEELLRAHGDAMIDQIEAEANRNERLRQALSSARYAVPAHLADRVRSAAGPFWTAQWI